MEDNGLWERCVAFHGHECPGLMIGFRAALYGGRLLDLGYSEDEDVVCITENDACGVDAVQVITGCTAGKGNLIFRITGKEAFSFYDRRTGRSVRLVLKAGPSGLSRRERFIYLRDSTDGDLFDTTETVFSIPDEARIYRSLPCEGCGEMTGEKWLSEINGHLLCPTCAERSGQTEDR